MICLNQVSIAPCAPASSYARDKLHLAALRLSGSGALSLRFARAANDLTAVVPEDLPPPFRLRFRRVKAQIALHRGNREKTAAELELLASTIE